MPYRGGGAGGGDSGKLCYGPFLRVKLCVGVEGGGGCQGEFGGMIPNGGGVRSAPRRQVLKGSGDPGTFRPSLTGMNSRQGRRNRRDRERAMRYNCHFI